MIALLLLAEFPKVWRRDKDGVWRIKGDSYSPAPNGFDVRGGIHRRS